MRYSPQQTAYRAFLSENDKEFLHDLAGKYPLEVFKRDARNVEEMTVDFVYTSAKIEGNTYDRIDTDNLLRMGITAGGKRFSDAVMLLNLRNGFERVMLTESNTQLDFEYLTDLHAMLMRDLLPVSEQGAVRRTGVRIGASQYIPLSDPIRLHEELKFILGEAKKYTDPFERAIYAHCNLAYLQYFRDGNKRTARMMQTAVLAQGDVLPLFFKDELIDDYRRSLVNYYETGDYQSYIEFFKKNYRDVIADFCGEMIPVTERPRN